MITNGMDYLSFSFLKIYLQEFLENILNCGEIKDRGFGFRGYHKSCYLIHGGRVAWSDNREEIHFDLNSKSLNYYFKNIGEIAKLSNFIVSKNGNVSRVDFFIDAKEKHFVPMKVIERAVRNKEYVSRAKTKDIYSKGGTVYVGAKKSRKLLRIYNKAKQLKLKGEEITRFEMALRDRYAKEYIKKLVEIYNSCQSEDKIQELIASIFRSYCDFVVVKGTCSTKWVQKRWWKKIVGNVEKFKFSDNKPSNPINVKCFKKPVLVNEKFLNFMNEITNSEDINFSKV